MATYYETGRISGGSGGRQMYATCSQTKGTSSENKSIINWTIYAVNDGTWYDTGPTTLWIGGNKVYELGRVGWWTGAFPAAIGSVSGSFEINHNSDGSIDPMTVSFSTAIETATVSTTSGTWTLDSIARYFTNTPTLTLTSRTETSMDFRWNTSETCSEVLCYYKFAHSTQYDYVSKYSSSTGATSGTFSLTGLTPNSTYNIYIKAKRKDSQLYSESLVDNYTTYAYPYIKSNSANPLTIGNQQTVVIYNPLGRSINFYMKKDNIEGTLLYSRENFNPGSGENISYNFTPTTSTLYQSIPDSQSGTAIYYCTYGNHTSWSNPTGTYKIIGNEIPSIPNTVFTLSEGNSKVSTVTSSFVQLLSSVQATITAMPTSNNWARGIASCTATLSGMESKIFTKVNDILTWNNINTSGTLNIKVVATDTRGLKAEKSWNVTIVPYSRPSASLSAKRENNYGTNINLTVSYRSSSVNGTNGIKITYSGADQDGYIIGSDSSYETATSSTVVKNLSNVSNSSPYTFFITIIDKFGESFTASDDLPIGVPVFFVDTEQNGIGINKFPTKALDINGDMKTNGLIEAECITTGQIISKNLFNGDQYIEQYFNNQYYIDYPTDICITQEMIDKGLTLSFTANLELIGDNDPIPKFTVGYSDTWRGPMTADIKSQNYYSKYQYQMLNMDISLSSDYLNKYLVFRFIRFEPAIQTGHFIFSDIQLELGHSKTDYTEYKQYGFHGDGGNSYIQFSDGTMICRGFIQIPGNSNRIQVNLPKNFYDTTYTIIITNFYSYGINLIWTASDRNLSHFTAWVTSNTGQTPQSESDAFYIAMGRWK